MSKITKKQWAELFIRGIIFILTVVSYIIGIEVFKNIVYGVILVFFSYKMIVRLIPNKEESMGNQKVFGRNYTPEDIKEGIKGYKKVPDRYSLHYRKQGNRVALAVGIVWLLLNGVIFALYFGRFIDRDLLMVISMAFSVGDLICVLVVCPFQLLFMRNKCCNTCRIYNWDFAMMFTPLWVVPSVYNYILVILSLIVFFHWEINHHNHPERFYEETNSCLRCHNCKELMCRNKLRKVSKCKF